MNKPTRPQGQTGASREHEKYLSGQRPDLSKPHSYSRQVVFKRFSEITKQMLGLSLTYSGNTVLPQHSRQLESKINKTQLLKNRVLVKSKGARG